MNGTEPTTITADVLKDAIALAIAEETFLTVYVPSDPHDYTSNNVRLQVRELLDALEGRIDASLAEGLQRERERLESHMRLLRAGGLGLAIIASERAGVLLAAWLPTQPHPHASYGVGAYVLPLLNLQDEFQPVAFVRIESDKARLIVTSASRIVEGRAVKSEVPAKPHGGGWQAWEEKRSERHRDVLIAEHFKKVMRELSDLQAHHGFRRLYLGGPSEPLAMFKDALSHDLAALVAGVVHVDTNASDAEVLAHVLAADQRMERAEEMNAVESLGTRGEKRSGATIGRAATIWAMNRHQVHKLVLSMEAPLPARRCPVCRLLQPVEEARCVQCGGKLQETDLREDFSKAVVQHGIDLEIVNGPAAALLGAHEGVGALLKIESR